VQRRPAILRAACRESRVAARRVPVSLDARTFCCALISAPWSSSSAMIAAFSVANASAAMPYCAQQQHRAERGCLSSVRGAQQGPGVAL
jgi:hypothetical protein